jgi:hypothetical protein
VPCAPPRLALAVLCVSRARNGEKSGIEYKTIGRWVGGVGDGHGIYSGYVYIG